jgi:hypothetical protein
VPRDRRHRSPYARPWRPEGFTMTARDSFLICVAFLVLLAYALF